MSKKPNKVLIITGGHVNPSFLTENYNKRAFTCVICVDGGLTVADACNLSIQYIIGDFDTVDPSLLDKYKRQVSLGESHIVIKTLNPEKDMTDTQVAIELALTLNPCEIVLIGATGTRIDHMLANLNLLMQPLLLGIKAYLLDEHNKIYLENKSFELEREKAYGDFLSFLPFSECVSGLTLRGVKYELNEYELKQGDSIGISNEISTICAKISMRKGILVVVEAKD